MAIFRWVLEELGTDLDRAAAGPAKTGGPEFVTGAGYGLDLARGEGSR